MREKDIEDFEKDQRKKKEKIKNEGELRLFLKSKTLSVSW